MLIPVPAEIPRDQGISAGSRIHVGLCHQRVYRRPLQPRLLSVVYLHSLPWWRFACCLLYSVLFSIAALLLKRKTRTLSLAGEGAKTHTEVGNMRPHTETRRDKSDSANACHNMLCGVYKVALVLRSFVNGIGICQKERNCVQAWHTWQLLLVVICWCCSPRMHVTNYAFNCGHTQPIWLAPDVGLKQRIRLLTTYSHQVYVTSSTCGWK